VDNRISNISFDPASVGDDEAAPAFNVDANGSKDFLRDPGELASRIDKGVADVSHDATLRDVLDTDCDSEYSHVWHCITPWSGGLYQYIAIVRAAMPAD
jgi:hypothetical protein